MIFEFIHFDSMFLREFVFQRYRTTSFGRFLLHRDVKKSILKSISLNMMLQSVLSLYRIGNKCLFVEDNHMFCTK